MAYAERFVYCDNYKDTKKLLEVLQENIHNKVKICSILTLKKNWIARYRNIGGMLKDDQMSPFTYTTQIEIENADKIYKQKPAVLLLSDHPNYKPVLNAKYRVLEVTPDGPVENGKSELDPGYTGVYFEEEQEHFFNKNDILIWLAGQRGIMNDGYSMVGIDGMALQALLEIYDNAEMPEEYLKEGRIDIGKAMPEFKKTIAEQLLSKEKASLLAKAKTIELDGIEEVDRLLADSSLFRRKDILRSKYQ